MAKKDPHDDPKLPNIKILQAIRLKGEHVAKGTVVKKSAFPNKASWQNLVHMDKPRAEETDAKVGEPKTDKTNKTGKSGKPDESGEGNLPGT